MSNLFMLSLIAIGRGASRSWTTGEPGWVREYKFATEAPHPGQVLSRRGVLPCGRWRARHPDPPRRPVGAGWALDPMALGPHGSASVRWSSHPQAIRAKLRTWPMAPDRPQDCRGLGPLSRHQDPRHPGDPPLRSSHARQSAIAKAASSVMRLPFVVTDCSTCHGEGKE
jgi:hypothetical protein